MEAIGIILGLSGLLILFMCYIVISWGFVLITFYHWFIQPVFHTPNYTYLNAVCVMLFLAALLPHHKASIKKEFKDTGEELSNFFLSPWITFIIGWLFKIIFL